MQLIKLFNAYVAAEQMRYTEYFNGQKLIRVEREFPFEQAAAHVKVMAILKPHYQRYYDAESELIKQYAKKDENGNPVTEGDVVMFATPEDMQNYNTAVTKLKETEVEVEGLPVKMPEPNLVRCSWLENLEGIVEFV